MPDDKYNSILKITNIEDDIKKRREEVFYEKRKFNRDESIMKKRREKIKSNSSNLNPNTTITSKQLLINLSKIKENLLNNDLSIKVSATVEIRKILSDEKNPPIQEVLNLGMLPIFIEFLKFEEKEDLQFEAAWILTNIASGTTEQTTKIVSQGAIPIFINLIEHKNENLKEQSVWALGNIAGDSIEFRDLVLEEKVLEPMLKEISIKNTIPFLRNVAWTLSNLCRGTPGPQRKFVIDILLGLSKLIFVEDTQILGDVCWALSYLSDKPDNQIQLIIESGVVQRVVELLMHKDFYVQTPALRTIGNIVTGDDIQTQIVINCSVVPCLSILLNSQKKSIKKETCWTISNIAAGNSDQIQALIDSNLFPTIVYILNQSEIDIKKEAAWAISNAISGGKPHQISYLVKLGCIKSILDLLDINDIRLVRVLLEAIENILYTGKIYNRTGLENEYVKIVEQSGGIEKIENLQHHKHKDIYERSLRILERYFDAEEEIFEESEFNFDNKQNISKKKQVPNCSFIF